MQEMKGNSFYFFLILVMEDGGHYRLLTSRRDKAPRQEKVRPSSIAPQKEMALGPRIFSLGIKSGVMETFPNQ